jgi:plasmid maintenance system antidote protein VapI
MKTENKSKQKPAKKQELHPGVFFEKRFLKKGGCSSTTELAEKMDLPHETLLAFCKGKQDVTREIADRLAVVFGDSELKAQDWVDLQQIFNDSKDPTKVATALDLAKAKFLEMSKVHEMGTVAEIAQKLGISKSEVRRRKANNTLCELATTDDDAI